MTQKERLLKLAQECVPMDEELKSVVLEGLSRISEEEAEALSNSLESFMRGLSEISKNLKNLKS